MAIGVGNEIHAIATYYDDKARKLAAIEPKPAR